MEKTEKHTLDAVKNILLCFVICFIDGSLYSLGIFSTFVEETANPPGSLDGVWSAGMGLISLFCMPSMFFTGIYLSEGSNFARSGQFGVSKSSRARILSATGSLSFALLCVAGYGVQISSAILILLSFIPVGFSMGLYYVEAMEVLGVWVPHRPGLAIGLGQMMFGVGSIISSSIFGYLVKNYTTANALYIAAAYFALPTAAATPFLQWPQPGYLRTHEVRESHSLLQQYTPLSWKQLLCLSSFWMYVTTIFCLQSGYAFIGYYFKIGETFGADVSKLVTSFQVANLVGTFFRPFTGALADILKRPEGFFSLGSKNVIAILLLGHAASFLALVPASWMNSFEGYAVFAGSCLALFAAGSCCAPLLAREQFGAVNSSVVFGVGGSISMGFGETVSILLMAAVEWSSSKTDVPSAYERYYMYAVLWSLFGLATCLMLKSQTFESGSQSESVESPLSCSLEIVPHRKHMRSDSYMISDCRCYGATDPSPRRLKNAENGW